MTGFNSPPVHVKPTITSQRVRSAEPDLQRTKEPRGKGIFEAFNHLSLKKAEEHRWNCGTLWVVFFFRLGECPLYHLTSLLPPQTMPKCFLQHVFFRATAICVPLVRLRCSEQRITGVVNKLLPRSPPSLSPCVSPNLLSAHNSSPPPVNKLRREAVSAGSCDFGASARTKTFSKLRKW